jgi:hypothetical protein
MGSENSHRKMLNSNNGGLEGPYRTELPRWYRDADLSKEQLRLNHQKVRQAGLEGSVGGWELLDALDLSRFPPESFDAWSATAVP